MSDTISLFDDIRDETLVATSPQTLDSLSDSEEDQDFFVKKSKGFLDVDLKVDYSDFANHVFFNSALEYFNITGEKIINEYPFDGSMFAIESFIRDLDGYQRHVYKTWPKRSGHLRFTSATDNPVIVEDVGVEGGVAKVGLLSPNTGSLTIELWCEASTPVTGYTTDPHISMLVQKKNFETGDGYAVYLSGSEVFFRVVSGSSTNQISSPLVGSGRHYLACVCDRTSLTGTMTIYTGSNQEFPVVVSSASLSFYGPFHIGSSSMTIGGVALVPHQTASVTSKHVTSFTGNLDDVRIWKTARSLQQISSSFNTKIHAQEGLIALWRFNESGSISGGSENALTVDSSGHRLFGRIHSYSGSLRGSGSFLYEEPDPILFVDAPEVRSYVVERQTSGSDFDRMNVHKLTDLLPQQFFVLEELRGTEVLRNFLHAVARQFDQIKLSIDQTVNLLRTGYGEFDQAPDALLSEVGRFFGWDFVGNFLDTTAVQYMLGRDVLANLSSNEQLDTKLYEIKNEFWRRTLTNLMHLYKTKGTRESVQSLLRIYGINDNFVRLKEYAYSPEVELTTQRVTAEKSVPALGFGCTGSLTGSTMVNFNVNTLYTVGSSLTFETMVRFPLTASSHVQATLLTGSIWAYDVGASGSLILKYGKESLGSYTGSLVLSASYGGGAIAQITGAAVFDNEWNRVAVIYDRTSGTLELSVRRASSGEMTKTHVSSSSASSSLPIFFDTAVPVTIQMKLGSGLLDVTSSEYWCAEHRLWKRALTSRELDDHTMNFQSYGLEDVSKIDSSLVLHLRLNEGVTSSIAGAGAKQFEVVDVGPNRIHASGTNFKHSTEVYKRFLDEYSYIVPSESGWTENKIRIVDGSKQRQRDSYVDSNILSLEFNMVDALNEDLSQIMSSIDELEHALGIAATKYDSEYFRMQVMRSVYFKRLQGRLNFRLFADLLEFFDRSFIEMVKKLIPARARFFGDEFVVESHMLERPKVQYNRRPLQDDCLDVEGTIAMVARFTTPRYI